MRKNSLVIIAFASMGFFFIPPQGVQAQSSPAYEDSGQYVVRRGDSLSSIARVTEVPLNVIVRLNPRLNSRAIRVGDIIILPAASEARPARIVIEPARGGPGTDIRIRAVGFRPYSSVRILAGRNAYNLTPYDRARVDYKGRVRASVEVPEWARPGGTYVVAVESANRRTRAISEPFRVTRRIDGERIEATGFLRDGPECPILRSDDGDVYSLVGDLGDFDTGDHVRITGRTVEVSICQRGITVEVRRITDAE